MISAKYFNFAGLSPTRAESLEEQQRVTTAFNEVLFSEAGLEQYMNQLDACRQTIGRLVGTTKSAQIAFVQNSSVAFGLVLTLLKSSKRMGIITTDQEHPAVAMPLNHLWQSGASLVAIEAESEQEFLEQLERACARLGHSLVVLSHVSYKDGRVLPIKPAAEIARSAGCTIVVDGAQAVGHIPVDIEDLDVDVYFFSGHKWCFGPMGTGAMYLSERFQADVDSPLVSWNAKTKDAFCSARRFELGTQSVGLIAGLAKACRILTDQCIPASSMVDHRAEVRAFLASRKDVRVFEWRGPHAPGILSFASLRGLSEVRITKYLHDTHQLVVKPTSYPESPSCVRVSWAPFTEKSSVRSLIQKIEECLDTQL